MKKQVKDFYSGSFNYEGQTYDYCKWAFTSHSAKTIMFLELARTLQVTLVHLRKYFDTPDEAGNIPDRYSIIKRVCINRKLPTAVDHTKIYEGTIRYIELSFDVVLTVYQKAILEGFANTFKAEAVKMVNGGES